MASTATPVAAGALIPPTPGKPRHIKPPKNIKPNYNQIHRHALPVEIHPLPPLIPHNPLSLVAIALSYLARYIAPPKRTIYNCYFSSKTSSCHVTDHDTIRALWEMGFFGRGNLSRSEPTWHKSQEKKGSTAEENTGQRRNERRQQKLERAKKEQDELTQQLSKEKQVIGDIETKTLNEAPRSISSVSLDDKGAKQESSAFDCLDAPAPSDTTHEGTSGSAQWKRTINSNGVPTPPASTGSDGEPDRPVKRLQRSKTVRFSPTIEAREFDLSSPVISPIKEPGVSPMVNVSEILSPLPIKAAPTSAPISSSLTTVAAASDDKNQEHLNLSMEEALFLIYGLGVLNVYCEGSDDILTPSSLLALFRRHSYHPAHSLSAPQQPDDPFMLSYAVYHHYRSLGWVVRSGVKFAVDFLLYNRGPAFAHAEFSIIVLPAYSHPYWSEGAEQRKYVISRTRKSWDWLHGVNRVQAQVHKHLVLCYVEVPPPLSTAERGQEMDIARELTRYTIRDVSVKRWTPNRSRD